MAVPLRVDFDARITRAAAKRSKDGAQDQAGWHLTGKLAVPANITNLPLLSKCPELNPTENIWQFMRDNWLSNRVFKTYDDIVDQCCDAWNKLTERNLIFTPWPF
jgi:transposase